MNTKMHPGVYVPPPFIYIAFFLSSVLLQEILPINSNALHGLPAGIFGLLCILLYLIFFLAALQRFIASRNTLVTIKPANVLETRGIYSYSRNPMYVSLVLLYIGLAVFLGNWWTYILLPVLILVIQTYVIKKEEEYLQRAFEEEYKVYKQKVRRWI